MGFGMFGQQQSGSLLEGLQLFLIGCSGEDLGNKGHDLATWPITMTESAYGTPGTAMTGCRGSSLTDQTSVIINR